MGARSLGQHHGRKRHGAKHAQTPLDALECYFPRMLFRFTHSEVNMDSVSARVFSKRECFSCIAYAWEADIDDNERGGKQGKEAHGFWDGERNTPEQSKELQGFV